MILDFHIVLLSLTTGLALLYLLLQAMLSWRTAKEDQEQISTSKTSLIICARNERANLEAHLPSWLNSTSDSLECVVVNDASWDGSSDWLSDQSMLIEHLKVVNVSDEVKRPGKKLALTLGIKRAQHDALVFTDADCVPKSPNWISHMSPRPKEDFVLGYGAFARGGGVVGTMARMDVFHTAVQYLGWGRTGRPYMGVGRNMGYSRELYDRVGGFKKHYHIISGDDDLLVNHYARAHRTRVCTHPESHTVSRPPEGLSSWWAAKRRHLSVSKHYRKGSLFWLNVQNGALFLFYPALLTLTIISNPFYALGVWLGKTLIHLLISIPAARRLEEMDLLPFIPIFEPLVMYFNTLAAISARWRSPRSWK